MGSATVVAVKSVTEFGDIDTTRVVIFHDDDMNFLQGVSRVALAQGDREGGPHHSRRIVERTATKSAHDQVGVA